MGRRNQPAEGDGHMLVISKPPISPIELRGWCTFKESEAVKIGEHIGNFVVVPLDFARRLMMKGSRLGRRRACDAQASYVYKMWRRDVRPPSDSGNKARGRFAARAFENSCDNETLPLICPAVSNSAPNRLLRL